MSKEIEPTPRWKPRAKVEKVIIVEYLAGAGTFDDIARAAKMIYDLEGNLIAEYDPCSEVNSRFSPGEFLPWENKIEEPPCPTT